MNELVELYESTSEFRSEIDSYVENSCSFLDALEDTLILEKAMEGESEDTSNEMESESSDRVDAIIDKAEDNANSDRLNKTIKKTVDRVKRIESIVKSISNVKVHINNTWSYKKYIDKELDKILKDGDVDNVYGRFFLTQGIRSSKFDDICDAMRLMTARMRIPAKIKIDKQGRATEEMKRKDLSREGIGIGVLSFVAGGIIGASGVSDDKKLIAATAVGSGIDKKYRVKPSEVIKRKMNGTWGNPYETITIGELYKRLKELDPEHFASVNDNEIRNIRKFFSRNKKMNRLSKINAESSKKAIKLAGKIVNLQSEYAAYRQSIANYYITIINRTFALLNKKKKASSKKESEYVTESINLSALKDSIFKMKKSIEDSKKNYTIKKQKAAKNRIDEISIMIRNSSNEVRSTVLVIPDLNKFDDDIREIINYRISNTNADELLLPNIDLLKKTTNRLEYIISELNAVDVNYNELDKYANSIYNSNDDIGGIKNNNVLYYPTSRYHYHGDLPYYPSANNKYRNFYSDPTYSYPGFPRRDKLEPEKITVENLYKRWVKGTTDAKYYEIIGSIENKFNEFLNGDTLEKYVVLNRKSNDKVDKTIYALYNLADKYNSFSITRYNYYCKVLYRVLKHEM